MEGPENRNFVIVQLFFSQALRDEDEIISPNRRTDSGKLICLCSLTRASIFLP